MSPWTNTWCSAYWPNTTGRTLAPTVCRTLFQIVWGSGPPTYFGADRNPLFEYHRWKANLRILGVKEFKTVPLVPLSHPFVERLVGTVRREHLDQTPFWNVRDLETKTGLVPGILQPLSSDSGAQETSTRPESWAAKSSRQLASMTTGGNLTTAAYFNYQWQLELEFAPCNL